jgi:hypothetical protein
LREEETWLKDGKAAMICESKKQRARGCEERNRNWESEECLGVGGVFVGACGHGVVEDLLEDDRLRGLVVVDDGGEVGKRRGRVGHPVDHRVVGVA